MAPLERCAFHDVAAAEASKHPAGNIVFEATLVAQINGTISAFDDCNTYYTAFNILCRHIGLGKKVAPLSLQAREARQRRIVTSHWSDVNFCQLLSII